MKIIGIIRTLCINHTINTAKFGEISMLKNSKNTAHKADEGNLAVNPHIKIEKHTLNPKDNKDLNNSFHWHERYEIEIVLSGEGLHLFNDDNYQIYRGSAFICLPNDVHTVYISDNSLTIYNISFDDYYIDGEVKKYIKGFSEGFNTTFSKGSFEWVVLNIQRLENEILNPKFLSDEMIKYIFNSFLLFFFRRCHFDDNYKKTVLSSHSKEILFYLHSNNDKMLSLGQVARWCNVTPNYLGRIFKDDMGMSFNEYQIRIKVERAAWLITTTQDSIIKIAKSLGFTTSSYFAKSFRKIKGITPEQFRNNQY